MEHYFELPVEYKGETNNFKGRLVTFGFVYKFYIVVNSEELIFEKDDEGNYRVIADNNNQKTKVEKDLIEAIVIELDRIAAVK